MARIDVLALFRRMMQGDLAAGQAIADYLQKRSEEARAGNLAAKDEMESLAYQIVYERVSIRLNAAYPDVVKRGTSVASVISRAWLRIKRPIDNPKDLFCLLAYMVRFAIAEVVNDLRSDDARRVASGLPTADSDSQGRSPGQWEDRSAENPQTLAIWTEFHQRIATLPDDEREVFELKHFMGMSREAVSQVLGVSINDVRVRWLKALRGLHKVLPVDC